MKIRAVDVELAVARHFCYRRNLIVPNVSWGLGLNYEADLVVLRPSNYAIEVEIKVSASDIRADLKKKHRHDSAWFRQLYFAVPEKLAEHEAIPPQAGILAVRYNTDGVRRGAAHNVRVVRQAKLRKYARKWTDDKRLKLLRLAAMRVWNLKEHNMKMRRERDDNSIS